VILATRAGVLLSLGKRQRRSMMAYGQSTLSLRGLGNITVRPLVWSLEAYERATVRSRSGPA
jgi:hypothetical protein